MSKHTGRKLNHLIEAVPAGVALPSVWLGRNGYTPQLVHRYVQSGWLTPLAGRVYARSGQPVNWEGVVLGLQRLGEFKCHLGGVSALNRQGFAHYLSMGGDSVVHLWGQAKIPAWVEKVPLDVSWAFHRRQLFSEVLDDGLVMVPTHVRDWTLQCSAPEQAILEVLSEVDETVSSFTFAAELFEGLTALRPTVVNRLLYRSTQYKTKRLFLFLADYYGYPWTRQVDRGGITLGSGKRLITRGGKLDRRYQITVPEAYHAG